MAKKFLNGIQIPTGSPGSGKVWTASDSAGNGSWTTPSGSGDMVLASAQTVTGAKTFNAGSLLDKGNHVFDVKAYGAVGSGLVDDSTAIQAAITAAQTAGGGTVYLPTGTYVLNTTLTISADNITIQGAGWGSILKATTNMNSNIITLDNAALRRNLVFRDFRIDGNLSSQSTSGTGIAGPAAVSVFDRIWFGTCKTVGLSLTATAGATWGYTNKITRCLFDTGTPTGILIASNDENVIADNVFNDCPTACISDTAGTQLIENNVMVGGSTGTVGVGIQVTSTSNIIRGNVFDGIHDQHVKVTGDMNIVNNNRCSKLSVGTATDPAIQVVSGTNNIITGNTVSGGTWYTYGIDTSGATNTQLANNYVEAGTSGKYNNATTTAGIYASGGSVGVGTSAPDVDFHVAGSGAVVYHDVGQTGASRMVLETSVNTSSENVTFEAVKKGSGLRDFFLRAANVYFDLKGTFSNYIMFLDGTNNRVGIDNITSPTAKLHLPASTASASSSPLKFNSGTLMTTAEAGANEYDGKAFYQTPNASNRGVSVTDHLISQTADYTGTNVNTAQKVFNGSTNGAITLPAATSYLMEGTYHIHTTGTASHTIAIGFGGTATLTSIGYSVDITNAATEVLGATQRLWISAATSTVLTTATATATHHTITIKGIVRVNATGTFIPQYTWSAAPGVAGVTLANSYLRLSPIGSNTVATVGNWS